jgi:hypothetical protein
MIVDAPAAADFGVQEPVSPVTEELRAFSAFYYHTFLYVQIRPNPLLLAKKNGRRNAPRY